MQIQYRCLMLDLLTISDDEWLMFHGERLALAGLLSQLRPAVAIEVGVFHGAATRLLANYARQVYALDIDPSVRDHLARHNLKNVECIIGDSGQTIPALLDRLEHSGQGWDFVLIDASHETDSVRRDCQSFLRRPPGDCYLLAHDSFNPDCRRGIATAGWLDFEYCHYFDIDLLNGILGRRPRFYRQMWGGFALAVLRHEKRTGPLQISDDHLGVFQYTQAGSLQRERAALRRIHGSVGRLAVRTRMAVGRWRRSLARAVGLMPPLNNRLPGDGATPVNLDRGEPSAAVHNPSTGSAAVVCSPITGMTDVTLLRSIPAAEIIEIWQRNAGLDVTRDLKGHPRIDLYRCNLTGVKFFQPGDIFGSDSLYERLSRSSDEYYQQSSWEHRAALEDLADCKRVLEVGCGFGSFMKLLRNEAGIASEGIEINSVAVQAAQAEGLRVEQVALHDFAQRHAGEFDGLCAFQVLEHVPDLREFLVDCARLLKPGGKLVIAVPNDDSFIGESTENAA